MCVRRLPGRRRRHMAVSPRSSDGSAKNTTKEIRQWAIKAGREVSSRGRVPAEIAQAFHDAHAKKVQTKTAPVKEAAVTKSPVARTVVSKASVKKSSGEIREWAIGEGFKVSLRGRISAEIERAFHDAHAKKTQTKPAPVKKTAAEKTAAKNTAATPAKQAASAPAEKKGARKSAEQKKPVRKDSATKTAVKKKAVETAPTKSAPVSKAPAKTTREIREWAIGEGHVVSSRGRIPAEIERAFHDAQAAKVRTRTVKARTASATKAAGKTSASTGPVKRSVASKAPATKASAKSPVEKASVKSASVSTASARRTSREIRQWAIGEGLEVSLRGRIPAELERAFHDAQEQMPGA
ncbi:Lsr2 family protein (plasmid) [Rhodococcus sp. USK10]|nr:Lsr2 family protein [Rhodococcus sp. USK10]